MYTRCVCFHKLHLTSYRMSLAISIQIPFASQSGVCRCALQQPRKLLRKYSQRHRVAIAKLIVLADNWRKFLLWIIVNGSSKCVETRWTLSLATSHSAVKSKHEVRILAVLCAWRDGDVIRYSKTYWLVIRVQRENCCLYINIFLESQSCKKKTVKILGMFYRVIFFFLQFKRKLKNLILV